MVGGHQVSAEDCISDDGILRAACRACLTRRREQRAALSAPVTQDLEAEAEAAALQGDAEGVEVDVDEFDAVYGDGADLMDIDLPNDSALSHREATLLANLNRKLDEIKFEACNYCLEEGFDLKVADEMCLSCRSDKGDPVRKWSRENNIQPGTTCFRLTN